MNHPLAKTVATRARAAMRTNEPQSSAVIGLTILLLVALGASGNTSPMAWALGLTFWPAIAFVFNLIDPIPVSSTNRSHTDGY